MNDLVNLIQSMLALIGAEDNPKYVAEEIIKELQKFILRQGSAQ